MKCDEKEAAAINPFEPESPYVIVCEGFHDMALVCALLRHAGITNCDVTYPKKKDGGNGKDAIKKVVELLAGRSAQLKGVFVVTDADLDPDDSFKTICGAFVPPFKAPTAAFTIHRGKDYRTGVFLTPGKGKTGEVEDLLLQVALDTNPRTIQCIEDFKVCVNTMGNWSANKQAKMKLACYIATQCKNDPCCSPAFIWATKNKVLEIANPVFKELSDLLAEFAAP